MSITLKCQIYDINHTGRVLHDELMEPKSWSEELRENVIMLVRDKQTIHFKCLHKSLLTAGPSCGGGRPGKQW